MVRVIDRGRVGSHRTGVGEIGELENAVRLAIAQSRSRQPFPGLPHIPADNAPLKSIDRLYDPAIVELNRDRIRKLLGRLTGRRGHLEFTWADARVAVFNSRGVRRQTEVTGASLVANMGRRPGAGRAAGASRSLSALSGDTIVERARERHASGPVLDLPAGPVPVVFSPEATGQLCDILNRVAFSAIAYYQGSSFLRQHLGVQVFDRSIHLTDDGTSPMGMPFPFDLEGTAKRQVALIEKGTPKTPALDQRQAARLGLSPTPHAIGGNDARALNLFLSSGDGTDNELLLQADGGIWVGWLDQLECFEPVRVQVRAQARGVRRIENGTLAEAYPDLLWEDSLLRAFSSILAIGRQPVLCASPDGVLGGVSAPAVAVSGVGGLRVG